MRLGAFGRRVTSKFCTLSALLLAAFLTVGIAAAPVAEAKTQKTKTAKAKSNKPAYTVGTGAIIINEATGEVLYARNADKKLYPASMTKVMTLYLAFEALENGTLTLDQKLKVSREATTRSPSKLGLPAGATISVEDAVLALVTRSANDIATVLAEAIGGTEKDFGYLMTAKARELGMKNTLFRNASGLPNSEQVSTPRDMALLGIAIHRDFPAYYEYFKTRTFTFNGVTHTTHNRFVSNYKGADGIKTGFIGASGFNLLAAAERDGVRLVGVVFGGTTARSRDLHMAEIMDASFARAGGNALPGVQYVKDEPAGPAVAAAPERIVTPVKVAGFDGGAATGRTVTMEMLDDLSPSQLPSMPASLAPADENGEGIAAAARETEVEDAAETPNGWAVQVGAFSKKTAALDFAQKAAGKLSNALDHVSATVSAATGKKVLYRSRLVGFSSRSEAQQACAALKRGKVSCILVAPGTATASLN
jgi:D-alanyl-D-alanine carboxypeptidase